ncbi:hypothetical protein [Nocardia wallacei]|nr:hypothetical protein [Nocardia wallacei]
MGATDPPPPSLQFGWQFVEEPAEDPRGGAPRGVPVPPADVLSIPVSSRGDAPEPVPGPDPDWDREAFVPLKPPRVPGVPMFIQADRVLGFVVARDLEVPGRRDGFEIFHQATADAVDSLRSWRRGDPDGGWAMYGVVRLPWAFIEHAAEHERYLDELAGMTSAAAQQVSRPWELEMFAGGLADDGEVVDAEVLADSDEDPESGAAR